MIRRRIDELEGIMIEPRKILGLIPSGLYLVGVDTGSERFLYTASWLTQFSFEPCLVASAVRKSHPGHGLIHEAGTFSVNFVPKGRIDLARAGFENPGDRLQDIDWVPCPETGAPVIREALGYLGCRSLSWVDGGDHDLVIAEVVAADRFRDGDLLTIGDAGWSYS